VPNESTDVRIVKNEARSRYEIFVGDEPVGHADYRAAGNTVVFTHTLIDAAFEGRGLGGRLAEEALEDVRRLGGSVVPQCSFIVDYIRRHPEFAALVDEAYRDQVAS
jgi:predicted GNAT family acetyltransferase